ncbi:Zinc finger BED domain-containing protein RICESLEEPER 1, partial [Linum perenne]
MADSHAMTEDTGPTPGAPAPENQDGSQNPNTTQVEEVEEDAYQAPKRKKTSKVWNDFKEVQVGKEKKLECIYCKTRYLVNKTGTTSHLGRHSKSCMRKPTNLAKGNQQQLSIGRTINNAESVNAIENFRYDQANLVLPELWNIKTLLDGALQSEDERMVAMARKMLEKFDKYWGDCNLVIAFAAILDPRNKFTLVEHCVKDLYTQDNYTAHVQLIRQKLYDLYNEYVAEFNEKSVENPSEDGIDNAASTPSASVPEKKNTGRAKLDSLVEIIQS